MRIIRVLLEIPLSARSDVPSGDQDRVQEVVVGRIGQLRDAGAVRVALEFFNEADWIKTSLLPSGDQSGDW
jgi:hypothetical protein